MRKSLKTLGVTLALTMLVSIPALAGTMEQSGDALRYLKDDGTYATEEWVQVGEGNYYFDENGNSAAGWKRVNKKWYYLDPATGMMKTGWFQNTDGNWYYLDDETGEMLSKTRTPDGFWVQKNGIYDPEKGNIYDDRKGPGANATQEKLANILGGITFPDLTAFARENLSTDTWGAEGSIEALLGMGVNIVADLKNQGIEVVGENVFYVDGTTIIYSTKGIENPLFKLVKNGDHYELYVYDNIDKNAETPLYALCSVISSTPREIYNAMYTVAQYDQTIMSFQVFKTYGDSQIMYTVVGDYDYFYYSIK